MSFHGDRPRSSSGQGRRRAPNDGPSHPFDAFQSQAFGGLHPFGTMMGGGGGGIGGSSIFDDFFSRDPFDDPFFRRPMGMLGAFGAGNSLFGAMGMNSVFDRSGFFSGPSHNTFLEHHPVNIPTQAQPERRRGPIIEELSDDVEGAGRAEDQPIVEHPDDEGVIAQGSQMGNANQVLRHDNFQSRYQPQPAERGYSSSSSFHSYSFHSSSVSHGGGGSSYVRSSVRRQGPDGLIHEEHFEKDSAGNETRSSARGLRDKLHAMTKKRNASNEPESTIETLRNLTPEEAPDFDNQWVARANRSLPGWNHHAQMLESSGQRSNRRVPPALPQNNGDGHQARRFRS